MTLLPGTDQLPIVESKKGMKTHHSHRTSLEDEI